MPNHYRCVLVLLLFVIGLAASTGHAQIAATPPKEAMPPKEKSAGDLTEMGIEALMNVRVSTANRSLEFLEKTGSSVTVITEGQIRRMGARNLIDILAAVPGLGLTRNFVGQHEIEVRGVKTLFSEKVLVLLDGHSLNNQLQNGGFEWGWGKLAADNVKRVEVVRGPGSALYGANAFLAVINVITRDAADIDGTRVTFGGGSFSTLQTNVQFGQKIGKTNLAFNYSVLDSNGDRGSMGADVVGAAGQTRDDTFINDLDLKADHGNLSFRSRYARRASGPFVGAANALNDESVQRYKDWFAEVKYRHAVNEKLRIEPRLFHDSSRYKNSWELFTEGAFGGAFPDGLLLQSHQRLTKSGAEVVGYYDARANNKVVFGATAEQQRSGGIFDGRNFDAATFAPLAGGFQNVTGIPAQVFADPHNATALAVFAEDIWDVRKDFRLILGGRFDRYSNIGSSFNPRASATWEIKEGYNLRFLYGTAFRAPTFAELYNKNNPVLLGNPALQPEEIDTLELGVSGQVSKRLSGKLTGFNSKIKNLIAAGVPQVNAGGAKVTGIEGELNYAFGSRITASLNQTYQNAQDRTANRRMADTPQHRTNLAVTAALPKDWTLFTHYQFKGITTRTATDARPNVPSYGLLNLALSSGDKFLGRKGMQFTLGIQNLLDKSYSDPSPQSGFGVFNSDYPRSGRALHAQISYKF